MPAALIIAGAVATAKTGASYYAKKQNEKTAKKAGEALTAAETEAIKQQQEQQALAVEQQKPYSAIGASALPQLQNLLTPEGQAAYVGESNPLFQAALANLNKQTAQQSAVRGRTGAGDTKQNYLQNWQAAAMPYIQNQQNALFNAAGIGQNAAGNMTGLYAQQGRTVEEQQQALGNIKAGQLNALQKAKNQFYGDAVAAASEFGQTASSMYGGGMMKGGGGGASSGMGGLSGSLGGTGQQGIYNQNPNDYYNGISSIYKG